MTNATQLAPPGAGLPTLERWFSRSFLLPLRACLSKDTLTRWLHRETETVLDLATMHTLAHRRQMQHIVARQTARI